MIGIIENVIAVGLAGGLAGYVLGMAYVDGCAAQGRIADARVPQAMAVMTGLAVGFYAAGLGGLWRATLGG